MAFLVLFISPCNMARGKPRVRPPSSSPDPLSLPTPSSPDQLQDFGDIPPSFLRNVWRSSTPEGQLLDWVEISPSGQVTPPPKSRTIILSTPYNMGAASQHDYEEHDNRPEVDLYIKHDLEKRVILPLDDALELVLGMDEELTSKLEELVSKVQNEPSHRATLKAYLDVCDSKTDLKESALYQPFLALINTIAKLVYKLDRSFNYTKLFTYQQDHVPLLGANANLIPDLMTVRQNVFDASGVAPDCAGPGPKRFAFGHALHFWDIKPKKEHLDFGVGGAVVLDEDGEDYRPISVVNHHQRKRDAQLSADVSACLSGTSLKRSISEISDHDSTEESVPKRARTQSPEPEDAAPKNKVPEDTIGNETIVRRATALQMARYALEILSKAGIRTHCIGFVVGLDHIELLYYDRSSIVISGLLNIREDPAKFITMMIALLRLTPEERGIAPEIADPMSVNFAAGQKSGADPESVFVGVKVTMLYKGKNVTVTLGRIVKRQTVVLGRGTCIVEATCKEIKNKELVLKISFPSKTRKSEVEILDAIIAAVSKGSEWVHTHLPTMFAFRDVHTPDKSPGGRLYKYFQDQNRQYTSNGKTFSYEKRVMRLILLEKLIPIDELREARDYAQVFFDVLQVHRWVHDVPKILHRDLSQGNIMARRDSKGRYRGVLNDWDLSSYLKDIGQGATSHFRTGTRPFMAHELHLSGPDGPPMHRYRHDLESLFFIMVLLFCRHTLNPDASSEGPLHPYHVKDFEAWDSQQERDLNNTKYGFLMRKCEHIPLPGFNSFRRWIQGLHQIFFYGLTLKNMRIMTGEDDPKLTLNNVTYDAFFAVMASFKSTPKSEPLLVSYPPS